MGLTPRYRWVVLAAAFLIISMSIGTLFTLGVFLKPIEDNLHWSRSAIGAIGLLNWIVMGVGGLVAGYLSDRFGTRVVVLGGGAILGAGLALSSLVSAPWHLYVTFGVLVGGGVSCFYVPLTVTAIRWFGDRRGLAAAIVSTGNGFGVLVLSPLSRWLIDTFDWRAAFLVLGELAWLVVIPAGLLLREATPGPAGAAPRVGVSSAAAGSIAAEGAAAMRSWPFWAIALTHFACCAAHSGPIFHMVSHAIDQGLGSMVAASVLGVSGFSSIFGRVGAGMVADRVGAKPTLLAALVLQALMIASYLAVRDAGQFYAAALVFGVAYGGAMPLYPLLAREAFGERAMGTVYGAVFMVSCVGMGLGSYAGGAIHDAVGTYTWLFLGSFAIGTMAAVLGLSLRRPALAPVAAAS